MCPWLNMCAFSPGNLPLKFWWMNIFYVCLFTLKILVDIYIYFLVDIYKVM